MIRQPRYIVDTLCIIGLGLIGGSLALAVKQNNLVRQVTGTDLDSKAVEQALAIGAIDAGGTDLKTIVPEAEMVVLAVPVRRMEKTIAACKPLLRPGCIVTDVGSAKGEVVNKMQELLGGEFPFVGGHPMAGSEKAGIEAAHADMFKGACYVLTLGGKSPLHAASKVAALARGIGARPCLMSPARHDLAVAFASHLPYIAAVAISEIAREAALFNPAVVELAATGFRDTTRVASCEPVMSSDFLFANRTAVCQAIDHLTVKLRQLRQMVGEQSGELIPLLTQAKLFRDKLYPASYIRRPEPQRVYMINRLARQNFGRRKYHAFIKQSSRNCAVADANH